MPERNLRLTKIDNFIAQEISKIIAKEIELPANTIVTVDKVKSSRDLKYSCVWLRIMPKEQSFAILNLIKKHKQPIQQSLADNLSTRLTPKINFKIDYRQDNVDEVDKLLQLIEEEKMAQA